MISKWMAPTLDLRPGSNGTDSFTSNSTQFHYKKSNYSCSFRSNQGIATGQSETMARMRLNNENVSVGKPSRTASTQNPPLGRSKRRKKKR